MKFLVSFALYFVIILLSVLILANLYLGITQAVTKQPVPKLFGFAPLVVLSGSMEPAIYPGDLVVIREQEADQYKLGDVVSYLEGRIVYTHRIVGVEDGQYILKGDNNNVIDDRIRAEQFVGKVLLTIPKLGLLVIFLKRPAGMILVTILLLVSFFTIDYWKNRKRATARRQKGDHL